ncbi:hypothetical protein KGQ19_46355 [Catenulispora sp. NL8]|uniref:Bacteriophage lysin domain-containing protein n=1 Tax=Catenulispora pinistramenti TaxID=2705254 RepID=A0ABS5L7K8_9ACTN|nr:peptidoglycan amidohydrolase family protein [Catenulispora pinistramenti]MBS2554302.1 hypothetical protein [Catenulispora pinistramenti]
MRFPRNTRVRVALAVGATALGLVASAGSAYAAPAVRTASVAPAVAPQDAASTCTDTSSEDGNIAGCMAAARAMQWVDANGGQGVIYNQGDGTSGFGDYRADCSGFVSYALHISDTSPTPGGLVSGQMYESNGFVDVAKDNLQQGDVLTNPSAGSQGHVVMFDHWSDSSHTAYWGFEQHGPSGSYGTAYRLITYPYDDPNAGTFYPQHYTKLVPPTPPPAQTPAETAASSTLVHDGYTSVYTVDASNGHLQETYLPKMGGSWATQDLSNNYGTPAVLAGTQPVAIYHDGYTSVYTVDASNHHVQETYLPKMGGSWATQDLTANYGTPATSVTPTTVLHQDWLSVYTIDQSNGHLQETYLPKLGGPWYSKDLAATDGAPASANIKPVSIMHGGYTSVYTVDAGTGHVRESYIAALGQNWVTQDFTAKYGTPATTVAPTVAVHQGWTSVYTLDSNGDLQETYLSAIGQPWYSKDLVPQSGTPAASLNTAPIALFHGGYTSVYTVNASNGHLEESYFSQLGSPWTSQDLSAKYGTPNPTGAIDALVHPDANQNMVYASVYSIDSGSNQLQETYLAAIGQAWRSQSLSVGYGTPTASVI